MSMLSKCRATAVLWVAIGAVANAGNASLDRWVIEHAKSLHPLESEVRQAHLQVIKQALGQARVVGLGEPWHLQNEYLSFRNKLFQYLVEEAGITAYAAESGFGKSIAVDDYIRGKGALTKETIRSVFSFSGPLPENRALIEWMREYNLRPSTRRPIRFYGIDPGAADHSPHRFNQMSDSRFAAEAVLRYVNALVPDRAQELSSRFQPVLLFLESEGNSVDYFSAPLSAREAITTAIADLIGLFERNRVEWIRRTSKEEFERAHRSAITLRQFDSEYRAELSGLTEISDEEERAHPGLRRSQGFRNGSNAREAAAAENVRWILDQEGPRGRVFLFAASLHLQTATTSEWFTDQHPEVQPFPTTGSHLRIMLGNDLVVIGGICHGNCVLEPWNTGGVYGGLPALLEKTGFSLAFLDLRGMPPGTPTPHFSGRFSDYFDAVVSFGNVGNVARATSVCISPRDPSNPGKYAECPIEPDVLSP